MVEYMNPARRPGARRATTGCVLTAATALAVGCSGTIEDVVPDRQPTYKSSKGAPPLELPPDITSTAMRDALPIPGVDATYSRYAGEGASSGDRAATAVLPEIADARMERSGDQRWLVVAMTPEEAWPRLRDFWVDQGFAIETEEPDIGIMETDWAAENTPLPAGFLDQMTHLLTKSFYGVRVRDRFRTRIERGVEPGGTEIYISHRGAEQVYVEETPRYATTETEGEMLWQPRASDPGLEAEMLSRLMVFLGVDEKVADGIVAAGASPDPRARLVREDGGATALLLDEGFSPAWRRTGLALDRAGFTVDDRDRSRGLFFVRYAALPGDGQEEDKGWLSGLKFWGNDEEGEGEGAYVVRVIGEAPEKTRLVVLDQDGARVENPTTSRILAVLHEQLE